MSPSRRRPTWQRAPCAPFSRCTSVPARQLPDRDRGDRHIRDAKIKREQRRLVQRMGVQDKVRKKKEKKSKKRGVYASEGQVSLTVLSPSTGHRPLKLCDRTAESPQAPIRTPISRGLDRGGGLLAGLEFAAGCKEDSIHASVSSSNTFETFEPAIHVERKTRLIQRP